MAIPFFLLLLITMERTLAYQPIFTDEQLSNRSLNRFRISHQDNGNCWNRSIDMDGFISPIDSHNHFRPFGGPPVPFATYLEWMKEHGIVFSTMFGIGQLLINNETYAKPCCYYMHCPTSSYRAVPIPTNDIKNAKSYQSYKGNQTQMDMVHLTLSATYPNLQNPSGIIKIMDDLEADYPNSFKWAGEINVFKHALAANGFFDWPRVNVGTVQSGSFDEFMNRMSDKGWPVTLHCDLGCDVNVVGESTNWDMLERAYKKIDENCEPQKEEINNAKLPENVKFWKSILQRGDDERRSHYKAFFKADGTPKSNFRKIQHLQVWDAILSRYPKTTIVWAHIGLSIELRNLHPQVHSDIMANLFDRYPNLHADVSWDILAKLLLMNFNSDDKPENYGDSHPDFEKDVAAFIFNQTHMKELRQKLHDYEWLRHKDYVHKTGSTGTQTCNKGLCGPTHAMALYLDILEKYSDRFITGTDFVASFGSRFEFPGEKSCSDGSCPKPCEIDGTCTESGSICQKGACATGCVKDKTNHARQVTDTSSINIFLSDEAFRKIVLGENYFRITGLSSTYAPPTICGTEVEGGLPVGAIVGIISAGVVIIIVLILVLLGILWCRKEKETSTPVGQTISAGGNQGKSANTTSV